MFGKTKNTLLLGHKEKLLAEIAHYDKRIEEALKSLHSRKQDSFEDESIEENITNPYKLNVQPSRYELKQREANLSDRTSFTLELGMLTIMQSEVNVMIKPPEVSKPVPEEGVWYDVAAECKIDLICFTITFYAHKPHRKFAPTRYRNLVVTLVKPAQEKELSQSILSKLLLPNLALQVLQSYATAFRSRRTTLRELAEKYADKLKMEAMPEGGYRVTFLDIIQVDWTLENLWSPVVPFFHRMKFDVEYMPKDYIQVIGKLYKQFKDPSLPTSERTLVLSKIFDLCLQAAGPAREMQESLESDPETAGRLHERRTTIDQEPEVPQVEHSPKKKDPTGKENNPQNRKTSMAPPKTIPKKAKRSKPNEKDINENRKSVKRAIERDSNDVIKKSKVDDNDNRKKGGLKGGTDGIDKDNKTGDVAAKNGSGKDAPSKKDNGKNITTAKKDTGKDGTVKDAGNNSDTEGVGLENNVTKKSGKVNAKKAKETDRADGNVVMKKRDGKTVKSKGSGDTEDGHINNAKMNKEVGGSESNEVSSKGSKKGDVKTNNKVVKSKEKAENNMPNAKNAKTTDKNNEQINTLHANTERNVANSKKVADNVVDIQNYKPTGENTDNSKNTEKEKANKDAESTVNKKGAKKVASAKKDDGTISSSKFKGTKKSEDKVALSKSQATNKEDESNVVNAKDDITNDNTNKKKVNYTDAVSRTSPRTLASRDSAGKIKTASKNLKDTNKDGPPKNIAQNTEKEINVGKTREDNAKTKNDVKRFTQKDINTAKQKQGNSDVSNKNSNDMLTENKKKTVKQTDNAVERNKVVKGKPTDTNKETVKGDTNKQKGLIEKGATNKKSTEQTILNNNTDKITKIDKTKLVKAHNTDKNDEELAQQRKAEPNTKSIKINNGNPSNIATSNKTEKPNNTTTILKKNTNCDEPEKNVEKNMTAKNQKNNMLNVTITKPKIIPISKLKTSTPNKIVDKLKTKIPMMKSKMTFSSLGEKIKMNNVGRITKGVEKTKIPRKGLPVFKKVARNLPIRISPRKLPTTKPSTHGFSNK